MDRFKFELSGLPPHSAVSLWLTGAIIFWVNREAEPREFFEVARFGEASLTALCGGKPQSWLIDSSYNPSVRANVITPTS